MASFALVQFAAARASWLIALAALLGALASVGVGWCLFFVAMVDLRQIVWWWTMGGSFAEGREWQGNNKGKPNTTGK